MTVDRYKELCRRSALKILNRKSLTEGKVQWDKSELVLYDEGYYIPWRLTTGFDAAGNEIYIAELKQPGISSLVYANLSKVEEYNEKEACKNRI